MKFRTIGLLVLISALMTDPSNGDEHGEGISLIPVSEIKWKSGPPSLPKGAEIAVLEGDPNKEGRLFFASKYQTVTAYRRIHIPRQSE